MRYWPNPNPTERWLVFPPLKLRPYGAIQTLLIIIIIIIIIIIY